MFRQRIPEYTGVRCILKEARVLQCCHYTRLFIFQQTKTRVTLIVLRENLIQEVVGYQSWVRDMFGTFSCISTAACGRSVSLFSSLSRTFSKSVICKLPCQKRSLPSFSSKTARKVFLSEPLHLSLPFSIDVISIDAILTQCQANWTGKFAKFIYFSHIPHKIPL